MSGARRSAASRADRAPHTFNTGLFLPAAPPTGSIAEKACLSMRSCPICRGPSAMLGPLPGSNFFAGRCLPVVLPGGTLFRCSHCAMGFRSPHLGKRELDQLYSCGSPTGWQYEAQERTDWTLAAQAIDAHANSGAAVLDVGCFDGAFLATLNAAREKAGIEILPEAAARARERGVDIIGADYECLADARARYDAITAFDIIEHVENPLEFLRMLVHALRPGGLVLVSTGNLDAWSWRIMRNRYWYAAIPEHISFLSERWFHYASRELGLASPRIERYAHASLSVPQRFAEAAANMTFLVAPQLIGMLRRKRPGERQSSLDPSILDEYPPRWMSARDHILVALRRSL